MGSNSHATPHLVLDNLVVSRKLAQRLPATLAFHFHAVPVAKENDHITVAMAHPDDEQACRAVAEALHTQMCVVQSDSTTIDTLLAEIWSEGNNPPLRLVVSRQAGPPGDTVHAYAQYLSDLLRGQLEVQMDGQLPALADEASCDHDLVIFDESNHQSFMERLLTGPAGCRAAQHIPVSVLITRQPHFPLKKILLVTRGQSLDDVAVDWVIRLARPSKAVVTVLAVQPAISGTDSQALHRGGLTNWLGTDTPLGCQLRRIAGQLANWDIEGTLHFRQGSPSSQIQREVLEGEPDLIVVAADSSNWLLRRIPGQLINPLLRWVDRPVLIAKQRTA